MKEIPLASQTYVDRPNTAERLVNCYAEPGPQNSRGRGGTIIGHAGASRLADCSPSPTRALIAHKQWIFLVAGDTVYQISEDGSFVALDGTVSGSGRVIYAEGREQVMLATEDRSYVIETPGAGPVLRELPTARWGIAALGYIDGFFVYTKRGSDTFEVSGIDNVDSWNALDFATAESYRDATLAIVRNVDSLWIMGERSIEQWYVSGNPAFPLSRRGYSDIGVKNAASVAQRDGVVYWIGDTGHLYRAATGGQPERIDTPPIVRSLDAYSDPEATTLDISGHVFYVVSSSVGTYLFDATTGLWSERQSVGDDRWRTGEIVDQWGSPHGADYIRGRVLRFDDSLTTEDGAHIRCEMTLPPIDSGSQRLTHHALELDLAFGEAVAPGLEPEVMLDYSEDGGFTWSSERTASMGKQGQRNTRLSFRRLGLSRNRSYRFAVTAGTPFVAIAARLEAS